MIARRRLGIAGWVCALLCACFAPIAACGTTGATAEPPLAVIVDRIARPETFRITPDQAARHFEPIAAATTKGPGRHLWVFDAGAPDRGVRWLRVEFQPAAEGSASWTLLQGAVALAPRTPLHPDVYRALRTLLVERLGRPRRSDDRGGERTVEWSLGAGRLVVLRQGAFEHPALGTSQQVVLIEAVAAQGEEDLPRR